MERRLPRDTVCAKSEQQMGISWEVTGERESFGWRKEYRQRHRDHKEQNQGRSRFERLKEKLKGRS